MKKILFCTPYEGISNGNIGGISVWAKAIVAQYGQVEPEVDLVLQPLDRKTYVRGVGKFTRIWSGITEYRTLVKEVKKSIRNEKPDVLHLCTTASLGLIKDLLIFRFAKSRGIKCVLHFHCGRIPEIISRKNWETWLFKRVMKYTDAPVVMDLNSLDVLRGLNVKGAVYLPNPLSTFVSQSVATYAKDVEKVEQRLLFVGHVVDIKGVYELVEACCRVPDVTLRMVGHVEDNVKERLCAIAAGRSGDWLCFTGGLSREDTIKEMLAADVLVAPSYIEGFPNVILEAMACGTPIVASRVGAIPEMLDYGKCGVLLEPRSVDSIVEALVHVIGNKEEKARMSRNAVERVNSCYSISSVWSQMVRIWDSL